ncbi:MAG TPA: Clp protease ClpP [Prolixibacteraceae bacterium]|nr:Clp protease ClpP [Prolixibacteraceae bacterium]
MVKTLIIDGPIGPYGYSKQLIRNELAGHSKDAVIVKISSLGGSVDDALSGYDQFVEHGNVTAELSAFVASAATILSLGAKTVRMNENSFYLIHKPMNSVDEWAFMNEDEIETLIKNLEAKKQDLAKITLQMALMYVKKTGKTIDEIINLMKKNCWLNAVEAKNWGFVDEVFTAAVAVNYFENHQMVAMINSNGFPPLPRKAISCKPVAAKPGTTVIRKGAEQDEDPIDNTDWDLINNLPHNKLVDENF